MLESISADETKISQEVGVRSHEGWVSGRQERTALRTETETTAFVLFFLTEKEKRTKINNNGEFDPGSG